MPGSPLSIEKGRIFNVNHDIAVASRVPIDKAFLFRCRFNIVVTRVVDGTIAAGRGVNGCRQIWQIIDTTQQWHKVDHLFQEMGPGYEQCR